MSVYDFSMTLGLDLPDCKPSVLQRMDARWKLAAILLAALAIASLRTFGPALTAFGGAMLLVVVARLPWSWFARRMAVALTMYVLFLGWLPLLVEEGHHTIDIGFATLSREGLVQLLVLSAKIAGMISLLLVLLATTPMHHLFKAARALGLPRLLVLLLLLTYRYVFVLMEEFARIRTALRVRGFRNRADLHSYRTVGQVAGTLLVRSHERSERVGQAMRCRGFDGEYRSLHEFGTAWPDVVAFIIVVGYAVGLIVWEVFLWEAQG